jgi:hypothetical protein
MNDPEPEELRAAYARDLEREDPQQHWLIKDVWARTSVGVIGGAAKSFKSFLALDLAFSVASATPALGRFPVEDPGLALVYLAEDSIPHVRSRIEALCRHRGIDIQTLGLAVITEPSLQLDARSDQDRLRATIARLKPRLVLLDPLVRLHSGDENDSRDVSRLLGYFRDLQRSFSLALALVHHVSKKAHSRPGQALRGSSDIHAWSDSNAYLQRKGDHATLILEHRASRSPAPLTVRLAASGSHAYLEIVKDPDPGPTSVPSIEQRLLDLLATSTTPLSKTEIRARLRINNLRLGEILHALHDANLIRREADGWRLCSHPQSPSSEQKGDPQ